ncbi:MAG TPA: PTS sugar transporter subunit IIA [Pelagibacterium sp.]|uniref:PTS sugar transporter subunit IIA n=1 Tax=Pelagibacterium sp. TaxID=1967288 RepID=UPI002C7CE2C8|nr:PTS sugar transporter subunit IIA [Pelagibacterium sp.]HWJ86445.1 PTS sugar transporter subunit IIA [Pelagibacterium sp.]
MARHILTIAADFARADEAANEKAVLVAIARRIAIAQPWLDAADVLARLAARERLGTTAIGGGIALPHAFIGAARYPLLQITPLRREIGYGAPDGRGVDLFLTLIGAKSDWHLIGNLIPRLAGLAELPEVKSALGLALTIRDAGAALAAIDVAIAAPADPEGHIPLS